MKIEAGKEYKTLNGQRARVYAVDGHGEYPVHGAMLFCGGWHTSVWTTTGKSTIFTHDLASEWREPLVWEGEISYMSAVVASEIFEYKYVSKWSGKRFRARLEEIVE